MSKQRKFTLNFRGAMASNERINQNMDRLVKQDALYRALIGKRDHAGLLELASDKQALPCVASKAKQAASEMGATHG